MKKWEKYETEGEHAFRLKNRIREEKVKKCS